jgi:DNA-binding transcriptional regulator YiaG
MNAPAAVPVTLTIGDRTYLAGSVPDLGAEFDDADVAGIMGDLAQTVRRHVEHAAEGMAITRDAAVILERHRAALTLAVRTTPDGGDPIGPITRYLRERAGMTRTNLARAMGRDRRSVAAWEAGRPSRFTGLDDRSASRALGYAPAALMAVYSAVAEPVA